MKIEDLREAARVSRLTRTLNPLANGNLQTLILDECVTSKDCQLVRTLGYPALTISELELQGTKDDAVFDFMKAHKLGIVTYDKGFADPETHDLSSAPAVVILPMPHDDVPAETVRQSRLVFASYIKLQRDTPGRVVIFSHEGRLYDRQYHEGIFYKT